MFNPRKTAIVPCGESDGHQMMQIVSYADEHVHNKSVVTDKSRPFCFRTSQIANLDEPAVFKLISGWESTFVYKPNLTQLFESFVDEYGKDCVGMFAPALWFAGEGPSLSNFNEVRDGFGYVLMFSKEVGEAHDKVMQKNVPSEQCYHTLKSSVEYTWNASRSDGTKVVFLHKDAGKVHMDVFKSLGWTTWARLEESADFSIQ